MNFLKICQTVDIILGTQGVFTSVSTTNGFQLMIVEHVRNAWLNMQTSRRHWHFYRTSVAFSTVASQSDYTMEEVFGVGEDNPVEDWIVDRFILDGDRSTLIYTPYDRWIIEDHTASGQPSHFTTHPNTEGAGYLSFDNPDAIYAYTLHYFRKPQSLTVDADLPICPSEHHDAIVWQAVTDLAGHFGNGELFSTASVRANHLYGNLLRSQNPAKRVRTRSIV